MNGSRRHEPQFGPVPPQAEAPVPIAIASPSPRVLPWWGVVAGIAAIVGAVGFGIPMLVEQTSGPCVALEIRAMRINIANQPTRQREALTGIQRVIANDMTEAALREMATGYFASAAVRAEWPNIPPALSCGFVYWQSRIDPQRLNFARRGS